MSEPAWMSEIGPVADATEDEEFSTPDASASRDERRSFASYLGGKKRDEKEERVRRPRQRRKPASRPKEGAFVDPLIQLYGVAALTLMPVDEHCAKVILENAENCAKAVDELAYQNESVRRVLDKLVTGSAIGAVVMAHLPIIVAVAAHHGGGKLPFVPTVVEDQDSK